MVHYRPKSPQVLTRHTHIYKPKSTTKQTKLGLPSLLQARYLWYKPASPAAALAAAVATSSFPCLLRYFPYHCHLAAASPAYYRNHSQPHHLPL
ncbi:hypothetical protein GW17_00039280 [Ensete ventricosum]|uniref:Uncharacterized protein n=1 Tax=Ensete ventricosum TaxID=4639 RepID=A0A444DIF1_ENSVE|nr:hypothetical protein GW17_00039280 [Ensete ventricosum]RZR75105.1 hypothetical protein BHM03_00049513 [Ensete ventricosum]